jgi:hypothetical protein
MLPDPFFMFVYEEQVKSLFFFFQESFQEYIYVWHKQSQQRSFEALFFMFSENCQRRLFVLLYVLCRQILTLPSLQTSTFFRVRCWTLNSYHGSCVCTLEGSPKRQDESSKQKDESQQIAAWKLLYRVQHPAWYVSRLQTIPSPDTEL